MSGGERTAEHINAVDRNGKRYTTHCFGFDGEWWRGATILAPSMVAQLGADGLLPLTEVPEAAATASHVRRSS